MIEIDKYIKLFERIARAHNMINHDPEGGWDAYVRLDWSEMDDARLKHIKFPLLALSTNEVDLPASNLFDKGNDDVHELFYGTFCVLQKVEDRNNADMMNEAIAITKKITNDIVEFMCATDQDRGECEELLCLFKPDSVRINFMPSKGDSSLLGWKVSFTLIDSIASFNENNFDF